MTQEELREIITKGFTEMEPKIEDMSTILMDFYIKGFKTCWKVLTGNNLEL
jgi:hypothetical protein